jgi:pSer/pThr/pTyr-binding forkhead associated (FHA) protein
VGSAGIILELAVDDEPDNWILVGPGEFVLGRSRSCDLTLGASKVSRKHCRIVFENGQYRLEDLDSASGTWIGREKLIAPQNVSDGLKFRVADAVITCRLRMTQGLSEEEGLEVDPTVEAVPEGIAPSGPILWLSRHPGAWSAFRGQELVLGRAPNVDIRLDSPVVSRRHARITRRDDTFRVEDLGSTSGTRCAGTLVGEEGREVEEGTELLVGDAPLLCRIRSAERGPPEDAGQLPLLLNLENLQPTALERSRTVLGDDPEATLAVSGAAVRTIELALTGSAWVGLLWEGKDRSGEGDVIRDGGELSVGSTRLRLVLPRTAAPQVTTNRLKVSFRPGEWIVIDRDEFVVGRGEDCDLVVKNPTVSRKHCIIRKLGEQYVLEDLGGAGGVWLEDQPLKDQQPVPTDRPVRVGEVYLSFALVPPGD